MGTGWRRGRGISHLEHDLEAIEDVASDAWRSLMGREGYLPVLLLIFASMISIPLVGDSEAGTIFDVLLAGLALLVTIFRSTRSGRLRRASAALVGFTIVATVVLVLAIDTDTQAGEFPRIAFVLNVIYLGLLVIAFPMVLVRSFQHRKVSINTVCATLSAYLLIGLIFMSLYRLMGTTSAPFFTQFTATGPRPTAGQYTYFSFVTLTTVGYGDLTPFSDPGRAAVMVEAVLGQVFLVTTMARVISLLGEERQVRALRLGPVPVLDGAGEPVAEATAPPVAVTTADAPQTVVTSSPAPATTQPAAPTVAPERSPAPSTTARRTGRREAEIVRQALIDGWNGDPPDDW